MFKLMDLPYPENALKPYISANTIHYHYHKHHNGYINKLNKAIEESDADIQAMTLDELVTNTDGNLYNMAAQVWNHNFYWHSMCPDGGGEPGTAVSAELVENFGSVSTFIEVFKKAASEQFGSGWAWLVKEKNGKLAVTSTTNAVNPLSNGQQPLLTIDVWEHAYYLDYQNKRAEYIDSFFSQCVNWEFVEKNINSYQ